MQLARIECAVCRNSDNLIHVVIVSKRVVVSILPSMSWQYSARRIGILEQLNVRLMSPIDGVANMRKREDAIRVELDKLRLIKKCSDIVKDGIDYDNEYSVVAGIRLLLERECIAVREEASHSINGELHKEKCAVTISNDANVKDILHVTYIKLMTVLPSFGQTSLETCSICLDSLHNGTTINDTMCPTKHQFHDRCIRDWKKMKSTCPLCLKDLVSN